MTEPVVVTTGASSDIGEALALRLARDGAANVREEVAASHPGIQVSLVSPGVVHTEFGVNAVHGGPDSRVLPVAAA